MREHSLKGASAPRLARRESGKKSGAAEETRDFFFPLCFLVHKERGLRAPLKGAPETGANCDIQHGPQTRPSARTPDTAMGRYGCCCSHQEACEQAQVTIHTSPPGSLCSPPLPESCDPGTTSPGERTAHLRLVQRHAGLCHHRLAPHPYPSLPPS